MLTNVSCTPTLFSLKVLSQRTDESVVTLTRTDTSSDEKGKTDCRTLRICSHEDQRCAQHSQSHSVVKCNVVCGRIVRRVKDQVDSVID